MNITPNDLLRKLGSGVRPDATASGSGVTARAPMNRPVGVESADFASLLDDVHAGKMNSARPLSVATGANVELSSDQMQRLAVAADAAEAAGAQRLLAMIDGQGVTIDVDSRTITGSTDALKGRVVTDVDAFIVVPDGSPAALKSLFASSPEAGPRKIAATPGLDSVRNESLASLIETLRGADEALA